MGSRFKKWLVRSLEALCAVLGVIGFSTLVWWWLQPTLPENAADLQAEFIAIERYRPVAGDAAEAIRSVSAELGLPSVSVAVSVRGELQWAAAFGVADLSSGRKADLRTTYRTGSTAKAMTGLAAAQLALRGDLDLDASIHHYLPNYPKKRWDISLRQLAAHTGGVRHYANAGEPGFASEQFSKHHYGSVQEALSIFSGDPLVYEPGTDFRYSSHGFTLLSAAMEVAAGTSYPELMADTLWGPLAMNDTTLDDITKPQTGRATPYVVVGGRVIHVEGPDPSYKWAAGGLLSTPTDMVRLGVGMLSEQWLTESQRQQYFTSQPLTDGSPNPQGYALGWRNETQTDLVASAVPVQILHHGGQSPGGSSFILVIPDGEVCAAVMTNVSLKDPWPLREALYRIAAQFRGVPVE